MLSWAIGIENLPQKYLSFLLLVFTNELNEEQHFIIYLFGIALSISEVENLYMCFMAICISHFVNHLVMSTAHFSVGGCLPFTVIELQEFFVY